MKNLIAIALAPIFLSLSPNKLKTIEYYKVNLNKEKIEFVWKNKKNKTFNSIGNVLKKDSSYTMVMNGGMYTTTQNETEIVINRDDYINESMTIISDYITLRKRVKKYE